MTDVNVVQRYSAHEVSTIPKSKYFTAPYLPTAGVLRDTDIKRRRPTVSVRERAGRGGLLRDRGGGGAYCLPSVSTAGAIFLTSP